MQRDVILIFGQTGSGKTHMAKDLFSKCPRAIVAEAGFDEFPALVFRDYASLVLYLDKIGAFENPNVPFRVSYSPLISEHGLIFDLSLEIKNCWLFLEEADRFDDPRQFAEYDEVITRGRHYGISICALGLHPYKLPKELRRQATKIICFRQTERSDIEWIAEHVGEKAYLLPDLSGPPANPPNPYLIWTPQAGAAIVDIKKKIIVPKTNDASLHNAPASNLNQ